MSHTNIKALTCWLGYTDVDASVLTLLAEVPTFPKRTGRRVCYCVSSRNLNIDTTLKGGIGAATISLTEPDPLDS